MYVIGEEHAKMILHLQDACGWFLHCVVQVLSRARQVYPNSENDLAEQQSYCRLSALLSDTTRHHSNADISIDFDLIKDAEYSHFSTEGETNWSKVEHLKNVYESLIEHSILTGGAEGDEDTSTAITLLFSKYKELCQLLKVSVQRAICMIFTRTPIFSVSQQQKVEELRRKLMIQFLH